MVLLCFKGRMMAAGSLSHLDSSTEGNINVCSLTASENNCVFGQFKCFCLLDYALHCTGLALPRSSLFSNAFLYFSLSLTPMTSHSLSLYSHLVACPPLLICVEMTVMSSDSNRLRLSGTRITSCNE